MNNAVLEANNTPLDQVTIRPFKKGDMELERYFYDNLSAQSKHYRFMGGVNQLTNQELEEFCDIDFGDRMAFIASITYEGAERVVGISRYAIDETGEAHEFAVTVADEWHDKGLGTLLMKKLIEYAKPHGVKKLYSIELAENDDIKEIAASLGMKRARDPDVRHQVIYSLDL